MHALISQGAALGEQLQARDVAARLSGGVGIALRCPAISRVNPDRDYHDIDLCVASNTLENLRRVLGDMGYEPVERFNALNAGQQLMFDCVERDVHLDVFIDRLRMCHVLDFRAQLSGAGVSLPATDLLLSKLQIVQLTHKDTVDIFAILLDSEPSEHIGDPNKIELTRMAKLCAEDWGWFTTVHKTLEKVLSVAQSHLVPDDLRVVCDRARLIVDQLQHAPKSLRWKARARVGERFKWYELPEETLA